MEKNTSRGKDESSKDLNIKRRKKKKKKALLLQLNERINTKRVPHLPVQLNLPDAAKLKQANILAQHTPGTHRDSNVWILFARMTEIRDQLRNMRFRPFSMKYH